MSKKKKKSSSDDAPAAVVSNDAAVKQETSTPRRSAVRNSSSSAAAAAASSSASATPDSAKSKKRKSKVKSESEASSEDDDEEDEEFDVPMCDSSDEDDKESDSDGKKKRSNSSRRSQKKRSRQRKLDNSASVNASSSSAAAAPTVVWRSAEMYEQRVNQIMALLENLSKSMSPKQKEYFIKIEQLHQAMNSKVMNIVAYANRGQGKSTLINGAAVSFNKLKELGFGWMWGNYPLHAAGHHSSVTLIPAWLEFTDPTVAPQCLIKLSDNTEVDIFPFAEAEWSKSPEANNVFKDAPLKIRQLAIFLHANCHAEQLLSANHPTYAAQKAAGALSILHMTLKSNWAFGKKFRVGDSLGWENKIEERLNGPLKSVADAIMLLTNRAMAQTDFRYLLEVDVFDRKNQPKKEAVLLNFYRKDLNQRAPNNAAAAAASSSSSSSSSSSQVAAAGASAVEATSIDELYKSLISSFEELLRDTEVLHGLSWDYRNELLASLRQNLVVRGSDHIGSVNAERNLQRAFRDIRNKYMRSRSIKFMKEASCLVFATKGLTSKLATKLGSTPYLKKEKEHQFAAATKEIDAMIQSKVKYLVKTFFGIGIMNWDESLYSAICSENLEDAEAAIARAQASTQPGVAPAAVASSSSSTASSSMSTALNERQHDEKKQLASLRTSLSDLLVAAHDKFTKEHLKSLIKEFVSKLREDEIKARRKLDANNESDQIYSVKMEIDHGSNAVASSSASSAAAASSSSTAPAAAVSFSSSSALVGPIANSVQVAADEYQDLEEFLLYLLDTNEVSCGIDQLYGKLDMQLTQMVRLPTTLFELIQRSMKPSSAQLQAIRDEYLQGPSSSSEGERLQQVKTKCEAIVIDNMCQEIQTHFVGKWKEKMQQVARDAWVKIVEAVKGISSGKTEEESLDKDLPSKLSTRKQCENLKDFINTFLAVEKAKEANPGLNRGGQYNDKIRATSNPTNMHHSLMAKMDEAKANDNKPVKNSKKPNEKFLKLRPLEIENATAVDLTKCAALPINFIVKVANNAAAAASSSSSIASVSTADRHLSVDLSITAGSTKVAVGKITLSSSLKLSLDTYRDSVSTAQFGVVEESKTRSLFPIYTPVMFSSLEDAKEMMRELFLPKDDKGSIIPADYEGMNHLLFFSVQPGQQQQWLEEALSSEFASEVQHVVIVIVPSVDVTIHLDVLRSILLHLQFEYAWRRTMNFKKIHELEAVKNATFSCQLAFAMISMQSTMRDLFRHTISECAKIISQQKLDGSFNQHMFQCRSIAQSDKNEAYESFKALENVIAELNEGKLRNLIRVLRIVNQVEDVKGKFDPLLKIVEPYFMCAMMAPFPRKFQIHTSLALYPDFVQVFNACTRMHSLVLEHLPALSQVPFNSMNEIVDSIESNEFLQQVKLESQIPSSKKGSKPSILIPTRLADLKEKKAEFLKSTLQAEQRCKDRIATNRFCVPQVLCASFGLDLRLFSTKSLKTDRETRSTAAASSSNSSSAAAAASSSSSSAAAPASKTSSSSASKKKKKDDK